MTTGMKALLVTVAIIALVTIGSMMLSGTSARSAPGPTQSDDVQQLAKAAADQPKQDSRRDEAIESLRAVRSALDGGANLEQFRKYNIEARIKVDALPDDPTYLNIRSISDVYTDALTFWVLSSTGGEIRKNELQRAKQKYAYNPDVKKSLAGMRAEESMLSGLRGAGQGMNESIAS